MNNKKIEETLFNESYRVLLNYCFHNQTEGICDDDCKLKEICKCMSLRIECWVSIERRKQWQ